MTLVLFEYVLVITSLTATTKGRRIVFMIVDVCNVSSLICPAELQELCPSRYHDARRSWLFWFALIEAFANAFGLSSWSCWTGESWSFSIHKTTIQAFSRIYKYIYIYIYAYKNNGVPNISLLVAWEIGFGMISQMWAIFVCSGSHFVGKHVRRNPPAPACQGHQGCGFRFSCLFNS